MVSADSNVYVVALQQTRIRCKDIRGVVVFADFLEKVRKGKLMIRIMDDLRSKYAQLRQELDDLRQKDNHILFELGNPPEMDAERGEILRQMRVTFGQMEAIEAALEAGDPPIEHHERHE